MLRAFVSTSLSPEGVGDLLTMAGFELEGLDVIDGEPVLDLKVMANRGDGLSALGMAREVLAKDAGAGATELMRRAAERFPMPDGPIDGVSVRIETTDCTRYACRVIRGVRNGPSPDWLQRRVTEAGMRPISLLVDLTNYVMLELGQPLHAFDLATLRGAAVVVRQARLGERLTTLDGSEHELTEQMMMICDAERPVAAAGIMGGIETEVSESTTDVLLESAHFMNTSVRFTRRQLGLSTEASYRFERWVDPEGVVAALNRFVELYREITGDLAAGTGLIDVYPAPHAPREVRARVSRARLLLGIEELTPDLCREYLAKLGFTVAGEGEPFLVTPPAWRPDVEREEDVVEEIGRVHGYERIPERLARGATTHGGSFGLYGFVDDVREALLRCGFSQTISHSLRNVHPLDFPDNDRVMVRNPHSPEMAYLRNSVLPNLADAARRNSGREALHLFEIGRVFVRGDVQIDESPELGILSTGALAESHWAGQPPSQVDFFSMKGVVVALCEALRVPVHFDRPLSPDPRLHPTRQASVLGDTGNLHCGIFGQIHPVVAEKCGLPPETVLAELDLLVLYMLVDEQVQLKAISRNPAVRRDIAVMIDKAVPFERLQSRVREACGDVLERLWLFDRYEGKGIPEGKHSLGLALQLRKVGENFTDEEANRVRDRAVEALTALGATLR